MTPTQRTAMQAALGCLVRAEAVHGQPNQDVQDALRAALAEPAPVQEPVDIDRIASERYKVVPSHDSMFYRWAVVAGDGAQQLYLGREVECQNMARKFAGAFLDGAYLAAQQPAPPAQKAAQTAQGPAHVGSITVIPNTPTSLYLSAAGLALPEGRYPLYTAQPIQQPSPVQEPEAPYTTTHLSRLPAPDHSERTYGGYGNEVVTSYYTAHQMRDYARQEVHRAELAYQSRAATQAQPATTDVSLLDDRDILSMWHATSSRVPMCNHYNHFARAIEQAVRQKAGLA